ncbi:MAG TPA: hypothetical protein VGO00_19775, partial [Kofleriaceae bacterium]|nr:hypothetical protein [Kofleriaceae bacterium]
MRGPIWLAVVAACGGSDAPSGPTARFALPGSGVPAPLAVPFPSDIYRDADGTLVEGLTDWSLAGLDEPEPSAMLSQYGALDGFGVQSGIVFGVDGLDGTDTVDPATLTADRFVLIDVDAGAPVPCGVGYDAFAHAIVLVPDDVLVPGKRYAAGMLAGPAVAAGQELAASAGFLAVRDDDAAPVYGDAIGALVDHGGVDRGQLIAATGYTTSTDSHGAFDTAARLYAGAYG